jgi:hypothetical protein
VRVAIVHVGGRYAERVVAFLSGRSPGNVTAYQVPRALPPIVDDPMEYLPAALGEGDLILAINLHPDLLVELAARVGGRALRALVAPIEDPDWVKPGLQRQVTQLCAPRGIETAFPKPFCALVPNTPALAEFCEQFDVGLPAFELTVAEGRVVAVKVTGGAPCGLTAFVAERLVGLPADESLPEKAGQLHHTHPCLATMVLDSATGDTIMHASLQLLRARVRRAGEP